MTAQTLTAETATVGTIVKKAATGAARYEITEVTTSVSPRTGEIRYSVRVRKVQTSKGGLVYPIESLYLA